MKVPVFSSVKAMFRVDLRFVDLSLVSEQTFVLRIGLSSGGTAELGDKDSRFIVDVLARGALNVKDFSTCWTGGVTTTSPSSNRVCFMDTAMLGTIRRVESGLIKLFASDGFAVGSCVVVAGLFTTRDLNTIPGSDCLGWYSL